MNELWAMLLALAGIVLGKLRCFFRRVDDGDAQWGLGFTDVALVPTTRED